VTPLSADAKAILESMGDAFYALDGDWRIVYANHRALDFWQLPAEEVNGRIIWERLPQLVGTLNEGVLRRAKAEQTTISFEAPSPVTGIWVSVNVGPFGDGVTVYWRDMTRQKNAEQMLEHQVADRTRALQQTVAELRRSRERYSAVFEHAPVDLAMIAVQPDGRLICEDANPSWVRHSGFSREFVVGKTPEEVLTPEQVAFAMAHYRQAIKTGQLVEFEYNARFPAGEVFRRSFLVPLHGPDGNVDHILLTSIDLTEMRRMEAQLRQAQKMEAIGQLTGGVAHDFNNLLTAILGNLELLQFQTRDAVQLRYIEAAMRAASRGGHLTQQLLAYARRQNLSPQSVDVNSVITGMTELLQRSLGGLVQVQTNLDPGLWNATSDPNQLELVILNLAINSRDAMPGGGLLELTTRNAPVVNNEHDDDLNPGDYVLLSVTDNGTGMPPHVLEHAFEPFFTTKEVGKGSGLGLAQVYGVAKQFGGSVRLQSEPGKGTTVELFLPRADPVEAEGTACESSVTIAAGATRTVLVVDDEPDVRAVAAALLSDAGFDVEEAEGGHKALEILAQHKVTLIVVDYAMPEMSGVELVQAARQQQPGIHVLYVTGLADTLAPLQQGRDPVLLKPYTRNSLLTAVGDALRRRISA
jgi:PAS domain S-box-containing protein